jgi:hypothetical protein
MKPAKQKPNDACKCGSGSKFKRCCGTAARAAAATLAEAAPRVAPLVKEAQLAWQVTSKLMEEACDAHDAGEWARAERRSVRTLALAGDAFFGRQHDILTAGETSLLLDRTMQALSMLAALHAREGSWAAADDCYARFLALQPPAKFWARGITRLSHVGWRNTALESDLLVELPPAVKSNGELVGLMHSNMGLVYLGLRERTADAVRCFESALALLREDPPAPERDVSEAVTLVNLGLAHASSDPRPQLLHYFDAALRLVDGADGAQSRDAIRFRISTSRLQVVNSMQALAPASDAELALLEQSWAALMRAGDEDWVAANHHPWGTCQEALRRAATPALQRPWLLRAVALRESAAALEAAALLGCRACAAAAPGDAALLLCTGCNRVAYCGAACQNSDWRRHKPHCKSAESAEAALADAVCCVCSRALVCDGGGDEEAALVTLQRCGHFAHATCVDTLGSGCPACRPAANK